LTRTSKKNLQDAKYNVELLTKRMKVTWKAFEETSRRGWNRSIKAQAVRMMMMIYLSLL